MRDAVDLSHRGGRLVCHHLEFDAGIIARELCRAGLEDMDKIWTHVARNGVCTMDPTLGKWLKTSLGWELAPHMNGDTMKLDVMLKALAPEALKAISQRHDAGCDARLHVALFRTIENILTSTF